MTDKSAQSNLSDEHLLDRWLSHKDDAAFAELVERNQEFAFRTAYGMTGDRETAREIAQEAFIHLLRGRFSFVNRGAGSFPKWFFGVVKNMSHNTLRSERRARLRVQKLERQANAAEASETVSVADASVANETSAALNQALADLPAELRLPLVLHFSEGLSLSEISRTVGLSRRAVEKRMDKGLNLLRGHLAQAGISLPAVAFVEVFRRGVDLNVPAFAPKSLIALAKQAGTLPMTQAVAVSTVAGGLKILGISVVVLTALTAVVAGVHFWQSTEEPATAVVPNERQERDADDKELFGRWTFEKGPATDLEVLDGSWEWRAENGGVMVAHSREGVRVLLPLSTPQNPFVLTVKVVKVNKRNTRGGAVWGRVSPDEATLCAAELHRAEFSDRQLEAEFSVKIFFSENRSWLETAGEITQLRKYSTPWPADRVLLALTNLAVREIVMSTVPAETVRVATGELDRLALRLMTQEPEISFLRSEKVARKKKVLTFDDGLPQELTPLKNLSGKNWRMLPLTERLWGRLEADDHAFFLLEHDFDSSPYCLDVSDAPAAFGRPWEVRLCAGDEKTMYPYRAYSRKLTVPGERVACVRSIWIFDRHIVHSLNNTVYLVCEYERSLVGARMAMFLQNASVEKIVLRDVSVGLERRTIGNLSDIARSPEFTGRDYPVLPLPPRDKAHGKSRSIIKP